MIWYQIWLQNNVREIAFLVKQAILWEIIAYQVAVLPKERKQQRSLFYKASEENKVIQALWNST